MRITGSLAAASLALLASACSKPDAPTVAKTATPPASLAGVPQNYQRMRFVSPVEQSHGGDTAVLAKVSRHAEHRMAMKTPVAEAVAAKPDPLASLASSAPLAVSTSNNAVSAPEVVVALKAPPVAAGTPAPWVYEDAMEHRAGAVVIRGGNVQPEKCDPLSDIKARRATATQERGSFRAPTQGSSSVFSRGGQK
jgi:hypothetical protein